MTKILKGVIRGRTIELHSDLGIEEGRPVKMILRVKQLPGPPPAWQPGRQATAAGLMAALWTEEDDQILKEIYQDRKRDTRREIAP